MLRESERLLNRYNLGYSTASELMLGVLTLTNKREIKNVLRTMPEPVLCKLRHFVGYYNRETKVFNGPRPNAETVAYVKELLDPSSASKGGAQK
ncbi:MAG TPA: hypothetical protein VFI31_22055 [Pirellulales bacterium]|nr:hypothetical protein [Pirellulales bacterium]